jgi:hypothetical protein
MLSFLITTILEKIGVAMLDYSIKKAEQFWGDKLTRNIFRDAVLIADGHDDDPVIKKKFAKKLIVNEFKRKDIKASEFVISNVIDKAVQRYIK